MTRITNPVSVPGHGVIDRSQLAFTYREYKPDNSYLFDSAGRVYKKDKNGTLRRLKGQALAEFNKMFLEELEKLNQKKAEGNEFLKQVQDDKL